MNSHPPNWSTPIGKPDPFQISAFFENFWTAKTKALAINYSTTRQQFTNSFGAQQECKTFPDAKTRVPYQQKQFTNYWWQSDSIVAFKTQVQYHHYT